MSKTPMPLWDFSLAFYAQSGVADTCLQLQDEHGVNVNVLLWGIWLGVHGHELDLQRLAHAQARTQDWDAHYIKPLRALRRQMKIEFGVVDTGIEAVRTSIKHAELQAERQLQYWLEQEILEQPPAANRLSFADQANAPFANAKANISVYLHASGISGQVTEQVIAVMTAALHQWRSSAAN